MSTQTITTRTRLILQDTGYPFAETVAVDGISTVFDLGVQAIQATPTPLVILGGTVISGQATPAFVFDYTHGVIAFMTPPQPAAAILGVQGVTYDYFTDDIIAQAVTDGFNLHVNDQDPLPVIDGGPLGQPVLSSNEEYLVALLAAQEALWYRSTDASQIIDIHTPEGVFIPAAERYRQLTQQIAALNDLYVRQSNALGVGLYRIQILNQRRVSLTTNRLVPIFREQEYNQPYTGFNPTTGNVGDVITINGKYFDSTTSVTFGGVPSTDFDVISDTEITAEVPVGAQTGQIGIITPYGVVLTTAQFVVGQPAPFVLYGPEMVKPPIPPGL